MNTEHKPDHELQPAEEPHFICPTKEGHAGMDDAAEWAQTHPMVIGGEQ